MGKYSGTLHKLIYSACTADSSKKWDQVLFYLEGHSVHKSDVSPPDFDSPLPPQAVPSVELECELFDRQGPKREDTPLMIALRAAPANVVAALCQLGPQAARMVDGRQRLPLHWACRRSSDDPQTDKVLMILTKCYPEGLLQRDDGGRTPLHWLFWYNARTRSPVIVKLLAQEMPRDLFVKIRQPKPVDSKERYPLPEIPEPTTDREVPSSAAIIPDSKHGALPLHYAVMCGASKDALKALIQEYPASIAVGDRRGRSALAWYLGAGSLIDDRKHVCGEVNDPNAPPWWHTKLSLQSIQTLVSSKVARMEDDMARTPLHWACHFLARSELSGPAVSTAGSSISIKIFQILLDHNVGATTSKDRSGQTPLHVLFAVVAEIQDTEQQRLVANRSLREHIDLVNGGPAAFAPPRQLVELLLKSPEMDGNPDYFDDDPQNMSAAYVEDDSGLLPLHLALRVATTTECIQLLIQSNPTSLVHTSEEQMQTPLIHAFCTEYSAPLQPVATLEKLMAAYVTSRHGTFMDGRLALKMEDAFGMYPVHYACENGASVECLKLFVEKFNRCTIFPNADGDLPVHSLLSQDHLFEASENGIVRGATLTQTLGHLSDNEIERRRQVLDLQRLKMRILMEPLKLPEHLRVASFAHGMTSLHIAVAFEVFPYDRVYRILDTYPQAVRMLTTPKGHTYSCLDLHDRRKDKTEDPDQWHAVRELLYSFYPKLESHRRDEVLLDACVRLIRSEAVGNGSYHLDQAEKNNVKGPIDIDLNETLSAIQVPVIDTAVRPPKNQRQRNHVPPADLKQSQSTQSVSPSKKEVKATESFASMLTKKLDKNLKEKKVGKSIYDADLDNRYVVSPQNSMDEDDDDMEEFDESSGDEEYNSDEESASYDDDSMGRPDSSQSAGESVSQNMSQSWSYGPQSRSVTATESTSLLRKAIADRMLDTDVFEEKKEDIPDDTLISFTLSEVATRLWTFFVAYNNPRDPDDNYLQQVESIVEDLEFDVVERLIDLAVPEFASEYLERGLSTVGLTMRDIACPKVKELFESYYYFLGRFEFPTDADGALLHRSGDDNTVWIRATEHVVETAEYQPPKRFGPGAAEEAIWGTGEMVRDEEGYMASKFRDRKRPVYFKLTRSQIVYDNEVKCRQEVGMDVGQDSPCHILPILYHFNCLSDGKLDRRYRLDVNDERFRMLHLRGGESICLSDFPYAMVYPRCDEGDLFDFFYHNGIEDLDEIAEIATQVAKALKMLHDKGVVHRSLSMRSITMLPLDPDTQNPHRAWAVSELSNACRRYKTEFMGGISFDGSSHFETGLMPPEMFVKLSSAAEEVYKAYWNSVEKFYNIKVDKRVVEPYVDIRTGNTYVVRCHYLADGHDSPDNVQLPELPYKLVPARESVDLWCFGLLLFTFCSGGRTIFPTNIKTGHLLEHNELVDWGKESVEAEVYEHVSDPLAQDILLQLLAPYEERTYLSIDKVLSHPFFNRGKDIQHIVDKMVAQRETDGVAHVRKRSKTITERSEREWLQTRTIPVNCWNFDMMRNIHYSCSEIIRRLAGNNENYMPSSFLLLPYRLSSSNKKARLAPTTKKDVERAERMGVLLLSLARACQFAARVEEAVESAGSVKKWDAASLLEAVTFPTGVFDALKEEFLRIAADRIEAFRSDPTTAIVKLVERRYIEIKSFFKDAGRAFLYLVDEHLGVPLVGPSHEPYPLEISESSMAKVLGKVLPSMHCCSMVARGVSGSISGVVRLIFEAAYPHVPPSWNKASTGLTHILDDEVIRREVVILHRTISGLSASKARKSFADDLHFIRGTCSKVDVSGDFGGMKRVHCADSSLWTTEQGVNEIKESCRVYDFKQALDIQAALELKVISQEQLIKQLQDKLEWLSFRKELNLRLPEENSYSTHSAAQKSVSSSTHSGGQKTDRTSNNGGISFSSHSGRQNSDVIAPSISVSSSASTALRGSPRKTALTGDDTTRSRQAKNGVPPLEGVKVNSVAGKDGDASTVDLGFDDPIAGSNTKNISGTGEAGTISKAQSPKELCNEESSVITVNTKLTLYPDALSVD